MTRVEGSFVVTIPYLNAWRAASMMLFALSWTGWAWISIFTGVFMVMALLLILSLCKVAGEADEHAEKFWHDYWQNKKGGKPDHANLAS